MPKLTSRSALLCLVTVLAMGTGPAPAASLGGLDVVTSSGSHHFDVEIAADDASREKGLMFRKFLPADHGMLFEFDSEQILTFWMKDTPLSLDLVFIDAHGAVTSVAANAEPMSEAVIASGAPSNAVLELSAGMAARIGLKAGDHVSYPFFKN